MVCWSHVSLPDQHSNALLNLLLSFGNALYYPIHRPHCQLCSDTSSYTLAMSSGALNPYYDTVHIIELGSYSFERWRTENLTDILVVLY